MFQHPSNIDNLFGLIGVINSATTQYFYLIPPWPFIQGGNPYKGCHISLRLFILHLSHLKRKMRRLLIMCRGRYYFIRTKNRGILFQVINFFAKCNRLENNIYYSPASIYVWRKSFWVTVTNLNFDNTLVKDNRKNKKSLRYVFHLSVFHISI